MFNQENFRKALAAYKRDFVDFLWKNEQFKWEAVKHFQDHWDIQAENLAAMLKEALDKTFDLLASMNNFPRQMLITFATAAPDTVRAAFVILFDESRDLIERIEHFKAQFDTLLAEHGNGAKQHYQSENAISTYLWLRYPDKYYIYKYSEVRVVSKLLNSDYVFKKGAYAANLRNSIKFYNEICDALQQDGELRKMLNAHLTESCYPDPQLRTMAIDFGFYISKYYSKQAEKTTYLSEIIESLKELGGKGHLNAICQHMKMRAKLASIKTNPTWESAVRATIQSHSSDTQSYKEGNSDLFYSVEGLGSGVWGLRENDIPKERNGFNPKLSVEEWLSLINDPQIFTEDSLTIMRRMLDIGGEATCIQLAKKYGESWNYYNRGSSSLAQRVAAKTNCLIKDNDDPDFRWWPVLFTGRQTASNERGVFAWKLHDELKSALGKVDLSMYPLYSKANELEKYDRSRFLGRVYMSGENYDTLIALLKHMKVVSNLFSSIRIIPMRISSWDTSLWQTVLN